MKKTGAPFVSLVASLAVALAFPVSAFAFSGNGNGTSGNPYQISNCSELQEINNDLSAHYALTGVIDCSGVNFTPIGTSGSPFSGTFDGDSYSIGGNRLVAGKRHLAYS